MSGDLEIQFGNWVFEYFAPDISDYCDILLNRIDPIFHDVQAEQDRAATEFLDRVAKHHGYEDDPDAAYEAAYDHSIERALQFVQLRTVFLATGVSGLFHLFEKQIYRHINKELRRWLTKPIAHWREVEEIIPKFIQKHGHGHCDNLVRAFHNSDLQELVHVANAIKHGDDGSSYKKLHSMGAVVVSASRLEADGTVGPFASLKASISIERKDVQRYRDSILEFWKLEGTYSASRSSFK